MPFEMLKKRWTVGLFMSTLQFSLQWQQRTLKHWRKNKGFDWWAKMFERDLLTDWRGSSHGPYHITITCLSLSPISDGGLWQSGQQHHDGRWRHPAPHSWERWCSLTPPLHVTTPAPKPAPALLWLVRGVLLLGNILTHIFNIAPPWPLSHPLVGWNRLLPYRSPAPTCPLPCMSSSLSSDITAFFMFFLSLLWK